jgi:hypothetical protein
MPHKSMFLELKVFDQNPFDMKKQVENTFELQVFVPSLFDTRRFLENISVQPHYDPSL